MGREQQVNVTRTVTAAALDGRPVWRLVDAAALGTMTTGDTLEVDKATLQPVRRAASGGATIHLTFSADGAKGDIGMAGQTMPVDVKASGPYFTESAGVEFVIAGLPLAVGYETSLNVFALLEQKIRPMKIAVTGASLRSRITFTVQLTPLDGDESGTATLHVTRDVPHFVVTSTARLPAMMGGGTVDRELTAVRSP